jgi:hypothetical protein
VDWSFLAMIYRNGNYNFQTETEYFRAVRTAAYSTVLSVRMCSIVLGAAPGPSGAGKIRVAFGFGDAPSKVIGTVPAGMEVFDAVVEIDGAFTGGTTLSVGDVGDNQRLEGTVDNDPMSPDQYVTFPNWYYAGATVVRIYIGGGPAAGNGVVTVYFA